MFRKNTNITPQTVKRCSCIVVPCKASRVFACLHFFCGILALAASADSCKFRGALQFLLDQVLLLIYVWCLLLDWTAQGTTSKQVHNPPFPINLLSLLPLVGELKGRLRYLRTLIKVGFGKSKPTNNGKCRETHGCPRS